MPDQARTKPERLYATPTSAEAEPCRKKAYPDNPEDAHVAAHQIEKRVAQSCGAVWA